MEETRKAKRLEEKGQKENESVRRAKNKKKNNINCYNCGKKGHVSSECYNKQKCCQQYGHISTECKEIKNHKFAPGRGNRGGYRRGNSRGNENVRGRNEGRMNTMDEAVMTVMDQADVNKIQKHEEEAVKYADDKGII